MKTKILLSVTLSLVLLTACSDSSSSVVDKTQADVTGSSLFEDTSATDESSEITTTQATTTTAPSTTTTSEAEPSVEDARKAYLSHTDRTMEMQVFVAEQKTEISKDVEMEPWMHPYCQIVSELLGKYKYFAPSINYDVTIPDEEQMWCLVDDIRYPDMQAFDDAYSDIYYSGSSIYFPPSEDNYYREYEGRVYTLIPDVQINATDPIFCEILYIELISDTSFKAYIREWIEDLYPEHEYSDYNALIDSNLYQINEKRAELYGKTFYSSYAVYASYQEALIVLEDGKWKFVYRFQM